MTNVDGPRFDALTGTSRCFGYIWYLREEDVQTVIAYQFHTILGKKVNIKMFSNFNSSYVMIYSKIYSELMQVKPGLFFRKI